MLTEAPYAGEDGISCHRPRKRLWVGVGLLDVGVDRGLKVSRAGEHVVLQASAGQGREPAFGAVQLGGRGRREVQVPARELRGLELLISAQRLQRSPI